MNVKKIVSDKLLYQRYQEIKGMNYNSIKYHTTLLPGKKPVEKVQLKKTRRNIPTPKHLYNSLKKSFKRRGEEEKNPPGHTILYY